MSDLEITKLCAEAMGYTVSGDRRNTRKLLGVWVEEHGHYYPLHSDIQAMALVKKLGVSVDPAEDAPPFTWRTCLPPWDEDDKNYVEHSDLNRAICEVVAKMQQAK